MGKVILRKNGVETQFVNGEDFTTLVPQADTHILGFDYVTGNLDSLDPNGNITTYGSGSTNTYVVTYSELVNSITGGTLDSGASYLITDFRTCYDQPDFNSFGGEIIGNNYKQSAIEPIIVFATSANTISTTAYQPKYPKDRIQYDWTFNQTERTAGVAYGRIIERIDEFNNRTDYDHRTIQFKRYQYIELDMNNPLGGKVNVTPTSSTEMFVTGTGTTFTSLEIGDLVGFGFIGDFKAFQVVSISGDTDMAITGLTNFDSSDIVMYNGYYQNNTSYRQNNITTAFTEYYTFDYNNYNLNNYVGNFANMFVYDENSFILANNVFQGSTYRNNTFGNNCFNNSFDGNCENNTVGNYFYNNITENDFDNNVIGNYFSFNRITSNFYNNRIGENFQINYLVQNNFYGNNIGNTFQFNIVDGGDFHSNQIGNQFNYNTIVNGQFYKNVTGVGFSENLISGNTYTNIIGEQFYSNTIYSDFYDNQIFNEFKGNITYLDFFNNKTSWGFGGNEFSGYCASNTFGEYIDSNDFLGDVSSNNFKGAVYGNTVGDEFIFNNIGTVFFNNIISQSFQNNEIGNFFEENTVGNYFNNNNVGTPINNVDFTVNYGNVTAFTYTPTATGATNNIYLGVSGTTSGFGVNATFDIEVSGGTVVGVSGNSQGQQYIVNDTITISGYDYGTTQITVTGISINPSVYETYNCQIFERQGGDNRLSYYDSLDTLIITNINE